MTIREARAILSGPLRFGDETQLQAKQFLDQVRDLHDHLAHCEWCNSAGIIAYRGPCPYYTNHFDRDVRASVSHRLSHEHETLDV